MSREIRPSAIKAREQIKSASKSDSESGGSLSDDSLASVSSAGGSRSPKSLIESMDRFLDKNQDGTVDRKSTPWISTIRGPAARLESLRTVPKGLIREGKKNAAVKKKRSVSDSENPSFASSSSEEESELSDSSSDSSHVGKKRQIERKYAAPAVRTSGRLREQLGDKPRKNRFAEDSESSSESSPPRKWQPPKSREKSQSGASSSLQSKKSGSSEESESELSSDGSSSRHQTDPETDVEEIADLIVDKIFAKRKSLSGTWEYQLKWRGRSYVHCEWVSGSELQRDTEKDKRSVKLKNFNSKHHGGETAPKFDKGYFYNPLFETVEKIIAVRAGPEYLVKWNGLPYGESTWERSEKIVEKSSEFEAAYAEFLRVNGSDRCQARMQTDSRRSAGRVLGKQFDPTVDFAHCLKAVPGSSLKAGTAAPVEYEYLGGANGLKVFDFQKEGISWLLYNWSQGRGCLLADEMGLGKTVQTSVTLAQMKRFSDSYSGGELTMLIIAPLSTIEQWRREIKKWTELEPVIYHGNRRDRNVIKKYEFNRIDVEKSLRSDVPVIQARKSSASMPKFNVLITTFETVSAEPDFFNSPDFVWSVLAVDEAHKLKASEGKARTSVLLIPCRHRILLTGTPIQNNVTELWNLLHLCSPSVWDDLESFLSEFGNLKSAELTQKLQNKIQPFLLQRRKADVLSHLMPAKEETIVSVELTKLQKETYRAVYEKNMTLLTATDDKGRKSAPALTNVHMELRKVCNHPFLVQGVEDRVTAEQQMMEYGKVMESLINASGKMVFLDKLLEKLHAEKSKILIFSQFTMMLDLIEDYLRWKAFAFERLDGAVKSQQRQEAVDRFNQETGDSFVFLLSTKAGGVGLNLTAANYVLLFDHDWNPQNDLQAQARCHRIGQKKEVMIFRLVTRGTYEEKMFQVASQKLGLEQAVMSSGTEGKGGNKLSKEELDRLLREGAYAMMEDDDERVEKFCSENVDEILKNRSTTVSSFVKEGASGATNGFSKARFQVNEGDNDVDVNDPNFWAKIASNSGLKTNSDKSKQEQDELLILDYSQRKGRAKFGGPTKSEGEDEEEDEEEYSDDADEMKSSSASKRRSTAAAGIGKDKNAELRLRRMKLLFRFVCAHGLVQNKEIFDDKFSKLKNIEQISIAGIPAYADHLLLIIALFLQARQQATSKLDEIFFCPSVRAAIGLLVQFGASGQSPPPSAEAILLDSFFPDLLLPIDSFDLSVPSAIVPQPLPRFVTEAVPRNRNAKKLVLDTDLFNEVRFFVSRPMLLKKVIDKSTPSDWTRERDDTELLSLLLEHGREEFGLVFAKKNFNRFTSIPESEIAVWAQARVEKIIPKFTLVRACQLTLAAASFGYHPGLLERAMRATGYPWTRKFVCGESCIEMLSTVEPVIELLTPVTGIPEAQPQAADEASFNRFILAQLPVDTPLSYIDVADYGKALLYRTIALLGKKSEKHDLAVRGVCRISKGNEFFFFFPQVEEEEERKEVCLYPQRDLTRIEAFKFMWRFQALHFLRNNSVVVSSPFGAIALALGLDKWDLVTNVNRHIKSSECFRSLMKFVCQSLIAADSVVLSSQPSQTVKKRPPPPAVTDESSSSSAPKAMKLTEYFAAVQDLTKSDEQ